MSEMFNFRVAYLQRGAVGDLEEGEGGLQLEREPGNAYSVNAIRVVRDDGVFVGYVPEKVAVELAPLLDTGQRFTLRVDRLDGRYNETPYLRVRIDD